MQKNNDIRVDLSGRRTSGRAVFMKLHGTFMDRKTSPFTKTELFNGTALPTLLYGCEMWAIALAEEQKLAATQLAMVGIYKLLHIFNEDLRCRSKLKETVKMVARSYNWAGHMARMNDNWWIKWIVK